jgi:hypothetical protein
MSLRDYEAGRKVCLENMVKGDFSNGLVSDKDLKTKKQRKYWMDWAKKELTKSPQSGQR